MGHAPIIARISALDEADATLDGLPTGSSLSGGKGRSPRSSAGTTVVILSPAAAHVG
jgi:hypothetical protein